MKRDKNLETLSWEHHDGLVVALRVKKGLERAADHGEIARYVLHIWDTLLVGHFRQEEATLVEPLQKSEEGRQLAERFLREHEQFRDLVEKVRREETDLNHHLEAFAELLTNHIRFEEKEVFPAVERQATPEELRNIGTYLKKQHVPGNKEWPVEFWK